MKKEKGFFEKIISAIWGYISSAIAMDAAPDVISTLDDKLQLSTDRLVLAGDRLGVSSINNTRNSLSTGLESKTKSLAMRDELTVKPRIRVQPLEKLTTTSNHASKKDIGKDYIPTFKKLGEL